MKKWYKSKTLWSAILVIITSFTPLIEQSIKSHPTVTLSIISFIFGMLRIISTEKLTK